jgi:hypothetical protein
MKNLFVFLFIALPLINQPAMENKILTDIMSKYNPNNKTVIVDKWIDCYHIVKADWIGTQWQYIVYKTWPTGNVSAFGINHAEFVKMLNEY